MSAYNEQGRSCFCFCKGNQFYANHNMLGHLQTVGKVVFAFAKVINFMLITTAACFLLFKDKLFLLLQR